MIELCGGISEFETACKGRLERLIDGALSPTGTRAAVSEEGGSSGTSGLGLAT